MGPEPLLCFLVSQLCLVGNRILHVLRIPGAAVAHSLPLVYYSVVLGQTLYWYHGDSSWLPV